MDDLFVTQSNAWPQTAKWLLIFSIGAVLLALLGFLLTATFGLYALAAALLMSLVALLSLRGNARWELRFEDRNMVLTNATTGKHYELYDVPADEVILRQRPGQARRDVGDLRISGTIFFIREVAEFARLRKYIAAHYKKE